MGLSAVFDSVVLIDSLNGVEGARAKLRSYPERAISVISRTEVLTGTKSEPDKINAFAVLDSCENIPVTEDIANLAAALRREFRLKTPDAIIYATARILGVPLVTRDTGFPDEPDVVRI
jgi:predicted nucleic acid-binding protein